MSNETQIKDDDFVIDEEFKNLLPRLNPVEYAELEKNLLKDGRCHNPLVIWKEENTLIEGHHRLEICKEHGLPFAVTYESFESREAVIEWMIRHQRGRRNMNKFQWAEVVLKLEPTIAAEAKSHQQAAGGSVREKSLQPVKTIEKLAKIARMSSYTLRQVKFILDHADEDTLDKLRNGDPGYSINGVCEAIKEALGQGEVTTVGIVKRKPSQQTIEAIPDDGSISKARRRAKERASKKLDGKISQGLVEQVDSLLVLLEELEQSFPITEDRIYIYEAVNVWQNTRKIELE